MEKQEVIRCFDAWAAGWDAKPQPDPQKLGRIIDAAGVRAGVTVLDVACGTGVCIPCYLARGAAHITGVDISPEMIRVAASKFGAMPQVALRCADAETATFDRRFDCCVIFNAFPHFDAPEALLRNLKRTLRSGGTLTVAHDRGRAALARHHKSVGAISRPLPPAAELGALLCALGFSSVRAEEGEDFYFVSGVLAQTDTER